MKCKSCGRDVPDNSIFCNWCGEKLLKERKKKDEIKIPAPRKLPSGSWRIYLDAEKQSVTEKTKDLCISKAKAIRAGFIEAKKQLPKITLSAAYDAYIEKRKALNRSPTTTHNYESRKKNDFQSLMNLDISSITNERIQEEIIKMTSDGKSPKTIANAVGLLHAVLKSQISGFELSVDMPSRIRPKQRKLTDDEITKILAAVKGTDSELPVLLGVWFGLRMSEIRGLKFSNIVDHKIHVCSAIVEGGNGPVEKSTKSFAGDRWVELPKYIEDLIDNQPHTSDYIVTQTKSMIYHHFVNTISAAGIPHCRFHDLRHANAAVMIRLGINSTTAQARNGWASEYLYKEQYGYEMPDDLSRANNAMDQYFAEKVSPQKASTKDA